MPFFEGLPVVNCLFTTDEPITVNLSFSKLPNDTAFQIIDNAFITVSVENESALILKHIGKSNYSNPDLIPVKGREYRLSVEIPQYNRLTATGFIPASKTKLISLKSESGNKQEPVLGTGEKTLIPVENLFLI